MKKNSLLKNLLLSTVLSSAILGISGAAQAKAKESFSNVYSFGDSFSSQGTYSAYVMNRYGFSYQQGKTGFAIGNQTTAQLAAQLATYRNANGNSFDGNALYMVFSGSSDFASDSVDVQIGFITAAVALPGGNALTGGPILIDQLNRGVTTFEALFPNIANSITTRATNLANFVQTISQNGAKYIVILNNFDEALRQDQLIASTSESFKFYRNAFNKAIYSKIDEIAPNANVIYIDHNRLISEVTSNPTTYFSSADINGTKYNNGYFDASFHPTASAHKLLAQYVASVVEAPTRVALAREIPVATGSNIFSSLTRFAQTTGNMAENTTSAELIGDYQYASTSSFTKKQLGFTNSNSFAGGVMVNHKTASGLTLGARADISHSEFKFVKKFGKAKVTEYLFSAHGVYNFTDPFFIYGNFGVGNIKYDITRRIPLGLAAHSERGKPSGMHYLAMAGLGYKFTNQNNIDLIPYINVNYQTVEMKSYSEKGALRSTSMAFKIPKRQSVVGEVGLTIETKMETANQMQLKPFVTFSASHEFAKQLKRQMSGKVSDMPRYFKMQGYDIGNWSAGVAAGVQAAIDERISMSFNVGSKFGRRSMSINTSFGANIKL